MIRNVMICLWLLCLTSCTAQRPADEPPEHFFGPTAMRKSADGYVLSNHRLTAVINESTGAISLSPISRPATPMTGPTFSPLNGSEPQGGYVEARDEETWQYFGTSKSGEVGWRIVCCLHLDELEVTYLVQNKTDHPLTSFVQLQPINSPIQAFNEDPAIGKLPDGSIRGDERTLQPGERINFATRWTLR